MRITCVLLCDAVTAREGLLHVLGGGVTRLTRAEFPAPMQVDLALHLSVHPTEAGREHEVSVIVQDADGVRVAERSLTFSGLVGTLEPGEEFAVPLPLSLKDVPLLKPGTHSVEVLVDGVHRESLTFVAQLPPE